MALFRRRRALEAAQTKSVTADEDTLRTIRGDWAWGFPFASSYGLMYRRQPAVRAVVDFISRNLAQLTLKTYLRADNNDRLELDDHPLAVLLRNPNPSTSRFRFMRDTIADKAIYDRAYWWKNQVPYTQGLVRIPPARLARTKENGALVYRYNGQVVERARLVVFSGFAPEGEWGNEDGVSPLETLRRVLSEEHAAVQHRENFWRNAARRDGVIQRPLEAPDWSDAARQRFRDDLGATYTGAGNAGRTPILEEGMTWVGDAFSPKEAEYIEARRLSFEEVCRSYLIAPKLFGMGDIANANVDAFHTQMYQDTFGPWMQEIEDDIELQLLPDVDRTASRGRIYVEFNLGEKLKASFEEMARVLTTSAGAPVVSRTEARARMNLPRLDNPDYDELVVPLNVIAGGQPAPTVPIAVPQPGKSRKARGEVPARVLQRRRDAAATHTELLRRYFRAQSKAVRTKAVFDVERWNGKLTGELYAARVKLARQTGQLAAKQVGGVYREGQTLSYLQETARREAENINAQTAKALEESNVDDVFDIATGSRAERLGQATATAVINFARSEAAKQSQANDGRERTKTWVVTSDKSRHPEMDGETVAMNDTFSNGALWPGDAAAGEDEVAGCQCLLDLN